jgi:hypothetical protein
VNKGENTVPLEVFIQALTSQLDRAQDAMRLKATAQRPLTFAVKDISLELRSHVEMSGSVVRIRPAGPGELQASTIHLALTTITRPMIEENTVQLSADTPDEPSLKEMFGPDMSDDEKDDVQRRLEWAGVHTVSQLRDLEQRGTTDTLQRVTQLPVNRLRMALMKAAEPRVSRITPEYLPASNGGGAPDMPLLRIRGSNLMRSAHPEVRIGGERVPVVRASESEVVIAPRVHQLAGMLAVEIQPGRIVETAFDLAAHAPKPSAATAAAAEGGAAS